MVTLYKPSTCITKENGYNKIKQYTIKCFVKQLKRERFNEVMRAGSGGSYNEMLHGLELNNTRILHILFNMIKLFGKIINQIILVVNKLILFF